MTSDDQHTLTLSAETENSLTLMQFFLQSIDLTGDLTGATITLESDSPFDLDPSVVQSLDVKEDPDEIETEEEPETERTEAEKAAEPQPMDPEKLAEFREGSNPLAIMGMLYDRRDEGFFTLSEIRQFTPNDAGVPDASFSPILWDLADRGLIEKKDSEGSGRGKLYKITEKGVQSVGQHRVEDYERPPAAVSSG